MIYYSIKINCNRLITKHETWILHVTYLGYGRLIMKENVEWMTVGMRNLKELWKKTPNDLQSKLFTRISCNYGLLIFFPVQIL